MVQDLRYAIRGFRTNRGVTTVMAVSLALAIGATTATFTLVNAVMLRPLPFRDSSRIVMLWTSNTLNGALEQYTSLVNLEDWKARSRSFEDMAAYRESDGPVLRLDTSHSPTEWTEYAFVSANFFSLLGRSASIGRLFTTQELEQRSHVAVLSHRLWKQTFGGDSDVIGARVDVGGVDCEVIGVMPEDFTFPSTRTDLWLPASLNQRWINSRQDRSTRFGPVIGRLSGGTSVDQARAEMRAIAAQLQQLHPAANADLSVNLVPIRAQINGTSVPSMLTMLLGAVMFVLLIACANVANLQLARGLSRRGELSMRTALGADRHRLVRQLLTESALLAVVAGGVGLALAVSIVRVVAALAPAGVIVADQLDIDFTVALFTIGISLATGVLFGIVPALRISRDGFEAARSPRGSVSVETGVRALRGWLVACEFALAVVLLTGAGLFIRSLLAVQAIDTGFGDRGAVTAHLRFHNTLSRARRVALYNEAIGRLSALPGVRAVGAVSTMFWSADAASFGLRAVEGHSAEAREQWSALSWATISGDYFQALGVPLLRGRYFSDQDQRGTPPVVMVNETMARRFWPGEDPIGQRIKGFDPRGANDDWITVIGVVRDVRSRGLEQSPMAQIFETQAQSLDETENLVVSATAPAGLGVAMRSSIAALDPTAVLSDIATLDRLLDEQTSERRFQTYVLAAFGALALMLAASGIFGLMHYSVLQRTPELGLRMALGAQRQQVMVMIVREAMRPATMGMIAGLAGSLALTRLMSSALFGVTPYDPLTLLLVCLALAVLALAGSCAPAVRAATVNPLRALREG